MSRLSTQHRGGHIVRALFVCLVLTALAVPALAARVIDVRVGQHPTFTRVVFELDQMRGYRLARDKDADVLIVSLDAQAIPESLASRGMVSRVQVEQAVSGAVARIHLKGETTNPRVQEMILGKPARIVLDIMKPESMVAAEQEPRPAVKPSPTVVSKAPKPEPKPAAKPRPKPPTVKPQPKPAPKPMAKPTPKPAPVETASLPDAPTELPPVKPAPPVVAPKPEPVIAKPPVPVKEPVKPDPIDPAATELPPLDELPIVVDGEDPNPFAAPEPTPVEIARPDPKPVVPAKPAPSPPTNQSENEGGLLDGLPIDPKILAGGVGALLLGIAGFVWVRRRNAAAEWAPEDVDESLFEAPIALSNEAVAPESEPETGVSEGGNTRIPAGGFAMDDASDGGDFPAQAPSQMPPQESPFGEPSGLSDVTSAPQSDKVVSIFDQGAETASQGESQMSDMMSDLPADASTMSSGVTPPPSMLGSDSGGDVARMMEAMERRMSELEGRLDEANEAREKLERQVAAQAEELRVQRAAIARTQRALRGMTRTGDDRASEPALRDGDTQTRTRVTGGA